MDHAALSTLRLDLRPAEAVIWIGRVHRIEKLLGDRLRDASSGELREVAIGEMCQLDQSGVARLSPGSN